MLKKIGALLLALCLLIPSAGLAETKITFDMRLDILPEAFPAEQRVAAMALKTGLDLLTYQGEITTDEKWYALESALLVDGQHPITLDVLSTSRWRLVSSNVLGDEKLSLFMDAYLEFMMKPYNFMGLKTQYLALLTSRYAHVGALMPLYDVLMRHFGGEDTRTYTPAEVRACAQELAAMAGESRDFDFWIRAAFLDLGLDSLVEDFISILPEWAEECAGDEGLVITVKNGQTTWALGGVTVWTQKEDESSSSGILTLPAWDGVSCKLSLSRAADSLSLAFQLFSEDEGAMLEVKASALALPDTARPSGQTELNLTISGVYMPAPISEKACLDWEWAAGGADKGLNAVLHWLSATGESKAALAAQITFSQGDPAKLAFTEESLQTGTHFFSLYDETMSDFFTRVKSPALEAVLPFYMALPMPFLETVVAWIVQSGIAGMVVGSF